MKEVQQCYNSCIGYTKRELPQKQKINIKKAQSCLGIGMSVVDLRFLKGGFHQQ